MRLRKAFTVCIAISIITNITKLGVAHCQDTARTDLNVASETKIALKDALQQVANEEGITFLFEGDVSDTPFLRTPKTLAIANNADAKTKIYTICGAFDCIALQSSNVVVLKRRYLEDDRAAPQISAEEIHNFLRFLVRVTQSSPEASPAKMARQFYETLTPQQIHEMQASKQLIKDVKPQKTKGLLTRHLSMGQRNSIASVAFWFFIQSKVAGLPFVEDAVGKLLRRDPYFSFADHDAVRFFGYRTPPAADVGVQGFTPISPLDGVGFSQTTFMFVGRTSLLNTKPALSIPTKPNTDDARPRDSSTISLGDALKTASVKGSVRMEDGIARRQFSVILPSHVTLSDLPDETLLAAMASMCDLKVTQETAGDTPSVLLTGLQRRVRPPSPDRIPEVIRNAFPPALLRYLEGRIAHERSDFRKAADNSDVQEFSLREASPKIVKGLRDLAAQKIRADVEPKLTATETKRLGFSETPLSDLDRVALYLLTYCIEGLSTVTNEPPPFYITHFDDVVLAGNYVVPKYASDKFFAISLCSKDSEGLLHEGPIVGTNISIAAK